MKSWNYNPKYISENACANLSIRLVKYTTKLLKVLKWITALFDVRQIFSSSFSQLAANEMRAYVLFSKTSLNFEWYFLSNYRETSEYLKQDINCEVEAFCDWWARWPGTNNFCNFVMLRWSEVREKLCVWIQLFWWNDSLK